MDVFLVIGYPNRPGVKLGNLADLGWHQAKFLPEVDQFRPRAQEVPVTVKNLLYGDDTSKRKGLLQAMTDYHIERGPCGKDKWSIAPETNYLELPDSSLVDVKVQLTPDGARKLGESDRKTYLAWRSKNPPPAKVPDTLVSVARWFDILDGQASQSDQKPSSDTKEHESKVRPRSLALVEPNVAQLAYLDALLDVNERLRNGLNLAVIGPPPNNSGPGWPDWLRWASKTSASRMRLRVSASLLTPNSNNRACSDRNAQTLLRLQLVSSAWTIAELAINRHRTSN